MPDRAPRPAYGDGLRRSADPDGSARGGGAGGGVLGRGDTDEGSLRVGADGRE